MFGRILGPVLLVLPSGPRHSADISHAACFENVRVLLIDIEIGGKQHDLRRADVQRALVDLCLRPEVVASVHIATDCRSFSPLNAHLRLRPLHDPDGLSGPPAFSTYIHQQNQMIALCAAIATIMCSTGRGFTWENPPRLDGPSHLPWAWPEMGQATATLWQTSWLVALQTSFDLVMLHSSMCMFGSEFRRFFGLLMPKYYQAAFASLEGFYCPGTGVHAHHTPAHGVDERGSSRAALAGRYPWLFNVFLLQRHAWCAPAIRYSAPGGVDSSAMTEPTDDLSDLSSDEEDSRGGPGPPGNVEALPTVLPRQGLVRDGPELSAALRGLVLQAAETPSGFSSYRNLIPASAAELAASPLPTVWDMARRLAAVAADAGTTSHPTRIQWDGQCDWRSLVRGAPSGSVTLALLIGAQRVADWDAYLQRYQVAFDAIRAGTPVTDPGEFLIRESELPTWASPFVWEAVADGVEYRPVVRSDRNTVFPGRQVDRARMREVADTLRWRDVDADICDQAFEGGCELRTHAPSHTTASWHHSGVLSHFDAADKIVRTERAEEWTRVASCSLPFVPCIFSPRDVVMQERSRLEEDGQLTVYEKPRVTHNLSKVLRALGGRKHGESVNSAVPAAEKSLPGMPTVQQYARAQAVCDTAAGVQSLPGWPERRRDRRADHLVVLVASGMHDVDVRPVAGHRSGPSFEGEPQPPTGFDPPDRRASLLLTYAAWLFSDRASARRCVAWVRGALRDKRLGCTCAPHDCHGHLLGLVALFSEAELAELRDITAADATGAALQTRLFDVSLPSVPFARLVRSAMYGIDMESAYCFLLVQQADHYANCYLWPDGSGVVRAHVSMRVTFGGSPWPQRFERVALLNCAWIQHQQSLFDCAHPLPDSAVAWAKARRSMQGAGQLPQGEAQCRPSGLEPFIDDANGRAMTDLVSLPAHLASISVGAAQTAAIGAEPAHACSRVAVHCRIAIYESRRLGWAVADAKTMCGDGVLLLGAQLDTVVDRVRCPLIKRKWVLQTVERIREGLARNMQVDTALMARFTGRLTNLSQFFPELRLPLSVGYAISRVTWSSKTGSRGRPLRFVQLRRGGRREEELLSLLAVAAEVADDDWGVPMAPARHFPSYRALSSLTLLTDASRADADDGVGGFAFLPSMVGVVFMFSVPWPEDIKAALDRGAEPKAVRRGYPVGTPTLSLPVAEVFGSVALAAAVAAVVPEGSVKAVVAVGDCAPAASAISSLYSKSAQIRRLLAESRIVSKSWLGVSVPREWNSDADRLSHPSMAHGVAQDAVAVGLRVAWVTPPPRVFDTLRAASRLPMGVDDAEWQPS